MQRRPVVKLLQFGLLSLVAGLALTYAAAVHSAASDAPYDWRNVTVGGGGFAPNIIFSRAEKGLAYLRTDMGGAYRWDAREQRWIPLQDSTPVSSYMGIESLAADPSDPDKVYLAAGMYSREAAAILRSGDRGATWQVSPVPFRMGGNEDGRGLGERLAIDPFHTATLLFGSRHNGLWRSNDSGARWAKVTAFPYAGLGPPKPHSTHGGVSFVTFDLARSGVVYAGAADPFPQHLYASRDGGGRWLPVAGGPAGDMLPIKAEFDAAGNLYVAYANGIGPNGITRGAVWRLDTRSGAWTEITPDPATTGGYMGLSVDRAHPGRLAVSSVDRWIPGDTVWLSSDYGRHWLDLKPNSSRDTSASPFLNWGGKDAEFGHWIAGLAIDPFDGATLAYTTGATLYRTDDALKPSMVWRPWVRGIEQTAVITLISPTGGAHLISGFGDIAGFVHDRLDRSPPSMFLNPRLNNTNNLDYAGLAPTVVVRSGSQHKPDLAGAFLAWSEDGGHDWRPLMVPPLKIGDEMAARYDFGEAPINVSADGGTFVIGTPAIVATSDRGKTWFEPEGLPLHARVIADKADPKLLYAIDFGTSRIFASRDGAHRFSLTAAAGLPKDFSADRPHNREAQCALQATPGKPGELWLLLSGKLYRSNDAGETFARSSGDDIAIRLFGLGHAAPGRKVPTVFVAGEKGGRTALWRSNDGGRGWVRINDDQHQWGLRFRAIAGDPRIYGRVYVATDGRGILFGDPR
jgi:xyloglucan-specific exo-beta-1,4-glucanase